MLIPNNTHYFTEYSKKYNMIPDPSSFHVESSRRTAYFQRLYWEYRYTMLVRGIVFYYTFTYNNKSIPMFLGRPCFSYRDIRLITNGIISKRLERLHGARLKYFCSCESGDGKGKRGKGNNPHYHFIFFIQPIHDKDDKPLYADFKRPTPSQFRSYCRELWQGSNKYMPWQLARFGHVQEGNFCGEVYNVDAFSYVTKYVLKNEQDKSNEIYVENYYKSELSRNGFTFHSLYRYYKYLKELNPFLWTRDSFIKTFHLLEWNNYRKGQHHFLGLNEYIERYYDEGDLILNMTDWFSHWYIPVITSECVSYYKNNYSGKVRCSKSLGVYGLQFIEDIEINPHFKIEFSSGWKSQVPCMYYYRKLYYDVKKCPVSGNVLFVLSDLGIRLKLNRLSQQIIDIKNRVNVDLSVVLMNNLSVFDFDKLDSFEWFDCFDDDNNFHFKKPFDYTSYMSTQFAKYCDKESLLRSYAIYKLIYEYRSYDCQFTHLLSDLSFDSVKSDYEFFLKNSFYFLVLDDDVVENYHLQKIFQVRLSTDLISFRSHPYFQPLIKYFDFFDKVVEVAEKFLSDERKCKFKEKSDHQKKLKSYEFNCSIG